MERKLANQLKISNFLILISYQAILINFIFSIIFWIVFSTKENMSEIYEHWTYYIIAPLLITFGITYLCQRVVRSDKYSIQVKKYVVIMLTIFIAAVLSMIHNVIMVLMLSYLIPVFVSTMFADHKLTTVTYIVSQILLLVTGLVIFLVSPRDFGNYLYSETLVATGILLVTYLMARIMINFNEYNIQNLDNMYNDNIELEGKVYMDPITGLNNRRSYDAYLKKAFDTSQKSSLHLGLAIIDIDDFKYINDTYGHADGDAVLVGFAKVLMMNQSEQVHAFRIGGDEFSIIFENLKSKTNQESYQWIQSLLERIVSLKDETGKYSISCGIAVLDDTMTMVKDLFNAADQALYTAKRAGKNKVVFYEKK